MFVHTVKLCHFQHLLPFPSVRAISFFSRPHPLLVIWASSAGSPIPPAYTQVIDEDISTETQAALCHTVEAQLSLS